MGSYDTSGKKAKTTGSEHERETTGSEPSEHATTAKKAKTTASDPKNKTTAKEPATTANEPKPSFSHPSHRNQQDPALVDPSPEQKREEDNFWRGSERPVLRKNAMRAGKAVSNTYAIATTAKKAKIDTTGKDPATTGKDSATTANDPATTANDPATTANDPATSGKDPATTGNDPATTGKQPCL